MLFNSIQYLVFLPVAAAVYFCLRGDARRLFLLAASFAFYGFFSVPLSLLLVWSTVLDYTASRIISGSDSRRVRTTAMLASVVGNLGTLATFKYLDFFSNSLAEAIGFHVWPEMHLILPMGISFYTFQTMSYTIDVYRGDCKACKSILDVALYVSFFPQLVAGPIMRGQDLLPQFHEKHEPNLDRFLSGAALCCWGLMKKVFIADPIGHIVNDVYGAPGIAVSAEAFSGWALLLGTYGFAVQIYCDFSAYSDIAIGSARILGIRLMKNFDAPYLASSLRDFWRRWHISLSTWLRDYLYVPLGGNRGSQFATYRNLMLTMLLGGLWHGAAWTFVIWGALHGVYLCMERVLAGRRKPADAVEQTESANPALTAVRVFVTFHLVCAAWVFFRAGSVNQAVVIIERIVTFAPGRAVTAAPLVVLLCMLGVQWAKRNIRIPRPALAAPHLTRWTVYAALTLLAMALSRAESPQFIYFQF